MNVYVAGSTRDVERVRGVQDAVRAFGHEVTFDWTGAEGEIRTDGSWDTASEVGARIAQREVAACVEADLTVLLSPPTGGGLGCWIEMGATLASGGEVWVLEPGRDSVFWQHPSVQRFQSMRQLMASLAATQTIVPSPSPAPPAGESRTPCADGPRTPPVPGCAGPSLQETEQ